MRGVADLEDFISALLKFEFPDGNGVVAGRQQVDLVSTNVAMTVEDAG